MTNERADDLPEPNEADGASRDLVERFRASEGRPDPRRWGETFRDQGTGHEITKRSPLVDVCFRSAVQRRPTRRPCGMVSDTGLLPARKRKL
jgi:hypothetical protein